MVFISSILIFILFGQCSVDRHTALYLRRAATLVPSDIFGTLDRKPPSSPLCAPPHGNMGCGELERLLPQNQYI